MMGARIVWAIWSSWEGGRGGSAAYACVNLVTATATMALLQGGKSLSMWRMESQWPFMMAEVTEALMGADAARASVDASLGIKPLP
jgi:hypothetical protein